MGHNTWLGMRVRLVNEPIEPRGPDDNIDGDARYCSKCEAKDPTDPHNDGYSGCCSGRIVWGDEL